MKSIEQDCNFVNNRPSADALVADGSLANARSNRPDINRTERTGGNLAVSKPTEKGRTEGSLPCLPSPFSQPNFSPEASPQIQSEETGNSRQDRDTYIVHWKALRTLLRPVGNWFKDKQAYILAWSLYRHQDTQDGKVFAFPKVKCDSRNNPYKRYQLARSHSGRTIAQLAGVIANNKLTDVRLASLVFTFPREVSEQLADSGDKGRAMAWNCWRKLWAEFPELAGADDELAAMVNLHLWKTERPIDPHFHFHVLIPNYSRNEDGVWLKWFGAGKGKKYVSSKDEVRTGGIPLSDDELQAVKNVWTGIVKASCKRNGLKCKYFENGQPLNVYVDYAKWENGEGKAKFIHKVSYQRRHWTEDYAHYSADKTDCPDPPAWLEKYNNISRAFGWWKAMKSLAEGAELPEDGKIDIFTGEPLVRGAGGPIDWETCNLWSYDSVKGLPDVRRLSAEDMEWLDRAMFPANVETDSG